MIPCLDNKKEEKGILSARVRKKICTFVKNLISPKVEKFGE